MAEDISRRLDGPTQEGPWEINRLLQRKLDTRGLRTSQKLSPTVFLSLFLSLPLFLLPSLPHSHPPPPSLTNQYFPLCWLHLLSLCVVEKLATVASTLQSQLSWVWAHQVSASLDLSLKVFPEEVNRGKKMASWMNGTIPLATVPDLIKRGTVKIRQSTRSYLFFYLICPDVSKQPPTASSSWTGPLNHGPTKPFLSYSVFVQYPVIKKKLKALHCDTHSRPL